MSKIYFIHYIIFFCSFIKIKFQHNKKGINSVNITSKNSSAKIVIIIKNK